MRSFLGVPLDLGDKLVGDILFLLILCLKFILFGWFWFLIGELVDEKSASSFDKALSFIIMPEGFFTNFYSFLPFGDGRCRSASEASTTS